jgi:transposase
LTLGDSTGAIYLACGVTDLRRGFNGLAHLVAHELAGEPHSGAMYVFCNRARDAIKILFYHDGGLWVCAKRLEQGTFRWPERGERTVLLTIDELHRLLGGLDTLPVKRVRDAWWDRATAQRGVPHAAPQTPAAVGV